jgi:hypothetical protein
MNGAGRLMLLQNGQLLGKNGGFERALKIRFKSLRSEETSVRADMVHRVIAHSRASVETIAFNNENCGTHVRDFRPANSAQTKSIH